MGRILQVIHLWYQIREVHRLEIYHYTTGHSKARHLRTKLYVAKKPQLPFFISAVLLSNKGCHSYSMVAQEEQFLKNKIWKRDEKWHSIDFWKSARRLCSQISIDNKLKWLQYQILRNSLQTNHIVSHLITSVSSQCQYCNRSHLFWSCEVVQSFFH